MVTHCDACEIESNGDLPAVKLCPLHAAAAEMRDALVAIVGRMESELHWPRTVTRSREYVATINIARALLAKVEG